MVRFRTFGMVHSDAVVVSASSVRRRRVVVVVVVVVVARRRARVRAFSSVSLRALGSVAWRGDGGAMPSGGGRRGDYRRGFRVVRRRG
jgi:hypothetical protein